MNTRQHTIDDPLEDTCQWFYASSQYQDWLHRRNIREHSGLLWVKGKPGCGKSTLLHDALKSSARQYAARNSPVVGFFFNALGSGNRTLERTLLGLLRSLLYQLLPYFKQPLQDFVETYHHRKDESGGTVDWQTAELSSTFKALFASPSKRRITIFVDALDECTGDESRNTADFFRKLTINACETGAELNVCLSSRLYPAPTIPDCLEILADEHNASGITQYVYSKLSWRQNRRVGSDGELWKALMDDIIKKSSGVFLWAVLVVNRLAKDSDEGRGMQYLLNRLHQVPTELEQLFADVLEGLLRHDSEDDPKIQLETTLRFFQWVTCSARHLQLEEWAHIIAFIERPWLRSLQEWKQSEVFIEDEKQLEKKIRAISGGLVEVKSSNHTQNRNDKHYDGSSMLAGAGSQDFEQGSSQVVQFIHECVREFFISGEGFSILDPHIGQAPLGRAHLSILNTCLDFIRIAELESLLEPQDLAAVSTSANSAKCAANDCPKEQRRAAPRRSMSPAGFASSASHYAWSAHSNQSRKNVIDSYRVASSQRCLTLMVPSDTEGRIPYLLQRFLDDDDTMVPTVALSQDSSKIKVKGTQESLSKAAGCTHFLPDAASRATVCSSREQHQAANSTVPRTESEENHSPARQSSATFSITLDEFPALALYASTKFVYHAKAAEKEGSDPRPLIGRLNGNAWRRLLRLRESRSSAMTPMYFAAKYNLITWIRALREEGETPNVPGGGLRFPILTAANRSNDSAVLLLLRCGANPKCRDSRGWTMLHHLAASNNFNMLLQEPVWNHLKNIHGLGIVNEEDRFGQTALHLAAWQSNYYAIQSLLDYGAHVDIVDHLGNSALHNACDRDIPDLDVCQALLSVKPHFLKNEQGLTPWHIARGKGHEELIRLIEDFLLQSSYDRIVRGAISKIQHQE
ncbi:MAG: hypothetical protein Q9227_002783 [Pyrenula ochraceoflavens]